MPRMTRRSLLAALPSLPFAWRAALAAQPAEPPAPAPASAGRFELHASFPSRHVAARDVRVWLPPDYRHGERCHVLYMQDGQNLFAPANPWNHGPWDVDHQLLALRAQGAIGKTMVVGIDNAGADRSREYTPQAIVEALPPELRRAAIEGEVPLADAYLRFLVEELKPFIDRHYRSRRGPEGTTLMGSSRGALNSLYGLCRHPELFGSAGCLSTHWILTTDLPLLAPGSGPTRDRLAAPFLDWLAGHLPPAGRHRLYFDHGDQPPLDGWYAPYQRRMDAIAAEKGYRDGIDYQSRVFAGATHDESAWRARLAVPLRFLLAASAVV
jgi:enterochelin esterase-like enzyme